MQKSYLRIIAEAGLVGVLLVIMVEVVKWTNIVKNERGILVIAGIVFHLLFEVSGLNILYAKEYVEILSK